MGRKTGRVIGKMLESFGYTVILTESGMGGKEAIAEIRKISTTTPVFVAIC